MFGTVFGDCTPDCIALHKMWYKYLLYADLKAKLVKWKKVTCVKLNFPVPPERTESIWTLSQAANIANKICFWCTRSISLIVLLYKCCQHTDWQTQSQTTPKQKHNTVNYCLLNLGYQYFWFSASSQRLTRHVISFRATLDCASIHIHIPYYVAI